VSVKNRVGRSGDVAMQTGDQFCAAHGIAAIDYLKVDTEGYDLKVCQGFRSMIERQAIALIQVECGINPDNSRHVPLAKFQNFLAGYLLFRLYDQKVSRQKPRLRRANAVFVAKTIVESAQLVQGFDDELIKPDGVNPGAGRGPT
jgi:hypothetical protein